MAKRRHKLTPRGGTALAEARAARSAPVADPASRGGESGRVRAAGILIGIAAVVALVIFAVLVPGAFDDPLPERMQDGLTLAVSVLVESLPFVVLGVGFAVLVQVWLPPGTIERLLPKGPWMRRAALSLLGMVVPVCECGNVPLARGLMMRGFGVPDTLTFLMAAPIVNPIVIVTTHAAFGWSDGILVARLVGGFLIANLIGWLVSRHPEPETLLTDRFILTSMLAAAEAQSGRGVRSVKQIAVEFRAIMPALVIGAAIAGAIQVLVPREVLLAVGGDPVLSIVAMMALAMVVAICSNVDAFFALGFASTFTPGSIVAFLLVGPLVDVKMLALLRTTFTTRALVGIVVVVLLSAFVIATVVNLLA